MDINPKDFIDNSKFEFADFNIKKKNEIVFLCSNWLEFEEGTIEETINYWAQRFIIFKFKGKIIFYLDVSIER
jgi:hypothetical protein